MLSFTRKTDYALVAVADIALHRPSAVSARDISRRRRLPLPVLQKILTQLSHEGIVTSVKGPRGGYLLGRSPEEIPLAAVVDAVEGAARLTLCVGTAREQREERCGTRDVCPIAGSMRKVHDLLVGCLREVSVAQLVSGTVPVHLASVAQSSLKK